MYRQIVRTTVLLLALRSGPPWAQSGATLAPRRPAGPSAGAPVVCSRPTRKRRGSSRTACATAVTLSWI